MDAPWETSVAPNVACAGKPVELHWQVDGVSCRSPSDLLSGHCLDPIQVTIIREPGIERERAISLTEASGQLTVYPEQDTLFEFRAHDLNDTLERYRHEVRIVSAEAPIKVGGVFAGVCASAVPAWSALSLSPGPVLSEQIMITGICNSTGFPLDLMMLGGTRRVTMALDAYGCSEAIWVDTTVTILGVPRAGGMAFSQHCMGSMDPPADLPVEVFLSCAR